MMARMLGRLGWRGQCSCCNAPKAKKAIRAEERRAWHRRDAGTVDAVALTYVGGPRHGKPAGPTRIGRCKLADTAYACVRHAGHDDWHHYDTTGGEYRWVGWCADIKNHDQPLPWEEGEEQ